MKAIRPRALKFRGTVEAAGFLFDTRLPGFARARCRALAVWTPGAQVFQLDEALLVCLPAAHRVVCESASGAPLMKINDTLFAVPLATDEWKAVDAPRNSVVLARGGEVVVVPLTDAISQHPADWLDVTSFEIRQTASLGARPAEPGVVVKKLEFDARQKFDGVPKEAPELAEVLAALRSPGKQFDKATPRGGTGWREAVARILETLSALAASTTQTIGGLRTKLQQALAKLFGNPAMAKPYSPSRSSAAKVYQPEAKRKPSFGEKLAAKLRDMAARMLVATRLSQLIGKRQAQYIYRMMEMFERGDIQEALRHAIPLGGLAEAFNNPALSVPTARTNLTISPHLMRSGSSFYMGDELFGELRKLYRASFERLEAQGRIEEAAFVLAELLHANEEAIAFLERHGKLRLAAEMAEARELPPGLVVRQWFVAGDKRRAFQLARRTGAFADAVLRLEKTDKKEAEVLRLLWAGAVAEAGDYATAVEVIWQVDAGRNLALDWLEKAIEAGGVAGARMLARKLTLVPEAFQEVKEPALRLLEDESPEGVPARLSFAGALKSAERTPQAQALARAAIRAVLRDAAHTSETVVAQHYRQLLDFAADSALRADAPPLPTVKRETLSSRREPLQLRIAASDVGTTAISDVAFLPDGRVVAAMGEAGVQLLARDGRRVAHFDQPAHKLVLSDNGDRAIALAKRGEVWKLSRLDFLRRRAEDWCEARLDAFANDYDGVMWFIGSEQGFYAIDATAKRFDALWRVPEVEGQVLAVARSSSSCRFLTADWGREEWHYELPSFRLRSRNGVKVSDQALVISMHTALSAEGTIADSSLHFAIDLSQEPSATMPLTTDVKGAVEQTLLALPLTLYINGVAQQKLTEKAKPIEECKPITPSIFGDWVAAPVIDQTEARVLLIDVKEGKVRAAMALEKSDDLVVRVQKEVFTVADNRGRLLVMDLNSGHLIRNLRI